MVKTSIRTKPGSCVYCSSKNSSISPWISSKSAIGFVTTKKSSKSTDTVAKVGTELGNREGEELIEGAEVTVGVAVGDTLVEGTGVDVGIELGIELGE